MTELTIKFNYVQDYAIIPRKEFIKNVGILLPREMSRDCANEIIARCKHTDSDFSKETNDIRPLLLDLLDNIATTSLLNGKCEPVDTGWGLVKNGRQITLPTVDDYGNIAIKSPCFVKFYLSFNSQDDVFSIDDVIKILKAGIDCFVKHHPKNFPLDLDYVEVSFGVNRFED